MVTDKGTPEDTKVVKLPVSLIVTGAVVLVGVGVGLVALGGLPSRLESASAASAGVEVGPIALPGEAAGGLTVVPEVGALAPDFVLQTPEGESYRLSDLRGQPVLVNFWATWCGPCRVEMPAIQATYQARQDEGFVVLAVNHTSTDSIPAVVAYGEELGLTFPLLVDPGSEVQGLYRIRAYPSSFFVDESGVIQATHFGPMTEEQLDGYVDDLLR